MDVLARDGRPKLAYLLVGMLAVYLVAIVRTAWLAEDAYITLRTVDNFVHGYGLRWNVSERVQSYTHPLWMLAMAAAYAVTRESFFTVIALSLAVSMAAVTMLALGVARSAGHAIAAVAMLTLSRAFVDFSTGGFENGLTHLLLGSFIWMFAAREDGLRRLCFITALIACNRLDVSLIVAPALVGQAWQHGRDHGWRHTLRESALGFAPLFAWEAFSLFYYGFPFPNTAYVKLATGISAWDTARQGLVYLLNSLVWDPTLMTGILAGVGVAWVDRRSSQRLLAIGAAAYVLYLVCIGGDFMKGRFLTPPLYVLVCVIARSELAVAPVAAFAVGGALLTLQFAPAFQEPMAEPTLEDRYMSGVVDERSHYDGTTSLLTATRTRVMPSHHWANEGRQVRAEQKASVVTGHMGLLGFFAGPKPHIIDYHALTDAFLAHVPPMRNSRWVIGHWKRVVPPGYVESALSGRCQMHERSVCMFFERMHLVIAGPLLSWERIVTIVRMNAGAYTPLVNIDLFRLPGLAREPIAALAEPVRDGARAKGKTEPAGARAIGESGLDVSLDAPSQHGVIELALDSDDDYGLEFFRGERSLGREVVRANFGGGMRNRHVAIPDDARQAGYDRIRIQPDRGDGKYRAGYVRLLD